MGISFSQQLVKRFIQFGFFCVCLCQKLFGIFQFIGSHRISFFDHQCSLEIVNRFGISEFAHIFIPGGNQSVKISFQRGIFFQILQV